MSILVFGKTGQLARALARLPDVQCLGRDQADLRDPAACAAAIDHHAPRAAINAAAFTAVDLAEEDRATATIINAAAPGAMARACAARGIPLVQPSTEYVFDGSGAEPWTPQHRPNPINAYGCSKLAGEAAVRAANGPHAILRTSWVFSDQGTNFVTTMQRLAQTQDTLHVVADQIGGPTPATALAAACHHIAQSLVTAPQKSGTYHFAGAPNCSWADFARAIFAQTGQGCTVQDIPTTAYPTPAARPLNSRLDCTSLRATFGLERPSWRAELARIFPQELDIAS